MKKYLKLSVIILTVFVVNVGNNIKTSYYPSGNLVSSAQFRAATPAQKALIFKSNRDVQLLKTFKTKCISKVLASSVNFLDPNIIVNDNFLSKLNWDNSEFIKEYSEAKGAAIRVTKRYGLASVVCKSCSIGDNQGKLTKAASVFKLFRENPNEVKAFLQPNNIPTLSISSNSIKPSLSIAMPIKPGDVTSCEHIALAPC